MFWSNIFKDKTDINNEANEDNTEYIWVEGYKGTDSDMQGYHGFQFEIGKEYTISGEIEECKNGFHFSRTIREVRGYYDIVEQQHSSIHYQLQPTDNRFFTVKALVKKSDWNKELSKYVAKKIILTKEITNSDQVYEILIGVKTCYDHELYVLKDLDDVKSFLTNYNQWYDNMYDLIKDIRESELLESKNQLKNTMVDCGFSELFIELIVCENAYNNNYFSNFIKALYDENISRDMLIYHILKEKQSGNATISQIEQGYKDNFNKKPIIDYHI